MSPEGTPVAAGSSTPVVVRIGLVKAPPANGTAAPVSTPAPQQEGEAPKGPGRQLFQKGVSGNPGGRPKSAAPVEEVPSSSEDDIKQRGKRGPIRRELKELLEPLDSLGIKFILSTVRDTTLWKKRPEIVLQTLRLGWEYRHGKPRQPITGGDGGPVDILAFLQQAADIATPPTGS